MNTLKITPDMVVSSGPRNRRIDSGTIIKTRRQPKSYLRPRVTVTFTVSVAGMLLFLWIAVNNSRSDKGAKYEAYHNFPKSGSDVMHTQKVEVVVSPFPKGMKPWIVVENTAPQNFMFTTAIQENGVVAAKVTIGEKTDVGKVFWIYLYLTDENELVRPEHPYEPGEMPKGIKFRRISVTRV